MKKTILLLLCWCCISTAFSQTSGQWVQKANPPTNLNAGMALVFLIGDTAYGQRQYSQDIWGYSISSDSWNYIGLSPTSLDGGPYSAAFVLDNKGYIMVPNSRRLWSYDPANGIWTEKDSLTTSSNNWGTSCFVIGDTAYVGLGKDSLGPSVKFSAYSETTGWFPVADFPGLPRYDATMFSIDQYGYVGFGRNDGLSLSMNDFYRYDPSSNSWTQISTPPSLPRYNSSGVSLNGKGYAIGGGDGGVPSIQYPFTYQFFQYSPISDSWIQLPNYPGYPGYQWSFAKDNVIYSVNRDLFAFTPPRIYGYVFADGNQNCQRDGGEVAVPNISLMIQPQNILVTTDSVGFWSLDSLPDGNYTMVMDTTNPIFNYTCSPIATFNVQGGEQIGLPTIGVLSTLNCNRPNLNIAMPILRRCNAHPLPVYVSACNDISGGTPILGGYVEMSFAPEFSVVSIPLPNTYDPVSGIYTIDVGDIYPGQCVNFTIQVDVDCNASIGQTLCIEAELLPLDSCALDTTPGPGNCNLPWDRSSLNVTGQCVGDSLACFTITNTGSPLNGNMQCYSQIRVFYNGVLTEFDSIMLSGGADTTLCFPADGSTIRLEVDQHPLHPGNSHPNSVVELCGDSANWIPGLVNAQALDDADPNVDIFCGEIVGSFDPNDKQGFPTGLDVDHFILPNQDINYLIRFQNTGNDTAFTVIIRDTLDANFNLFTLRNGPSSHPNTFRILPGRVLEWRFDNILLPDSNVNEPESHGFVSFTVSQAPDLPDYTVLNNDAYIYFDGNAPVITNQTVHTIKRPQLVITALNTQSGKTNTIVVYPNPAQDYFSIRFTGKDADQIGLVTLFDLNGRSILRQQIKTLPELTFLTAGMASGVYTLQVRLMNGGFYNQQLVIIK